MVSDNRVEGLVTEIFHFFLSSIVVHQDRQFIFLVTKIQDHSQTTKKLLRIEKYKTRMKQRRQIFFFFSVARYKGSDEKSVCHRGTYAQDDGKRLTVLSGVKVSGSLLYWE